MSIVALSADPNYKDSDLSEEVPITCWSPENQPTAQVAYTGQRERYRGQGDGCSHGPLCPEDISVGVLELAETLIVLEWKLPLIGCKDFFVCGLAVRLSACLLVGLSVCLVTKLLIFKMGMWLIFKRVDFQVGHFSSD